MGRPKKIIKKLIRRFQPKALILVYHRISEYETDPQLLSVIPENFEKHLQVIKKDYSPVSLVELGTQIESGRIGAKSIAITFDDGYADNLNIAEPILEKYEILATVFVTAGYIGKNKEFWWDDLERLIILPEELPREIKLSVAGKPHRWIVDKSKISLTKQWSITWPCNPSTKYKMYRDLYRLICPLDSVERELVLDQLVNATGGCPSVSNSSRPLTTQELVRLSESELIEVGSHTMTHPRLTVLLSEDQEFEISKSKKWLEKTINKTIKAFSFPFGRQSDYDQDSIKIVKNAGYQLSCSNIPTAVRKDSDLFQLPRFLVRDWDVDTFKKRMKDWFQI